MPRCNDCNKFVSLDSDAEPEVDLDVADDGQVTGTVEITNSCADCGTELRTASMDVEVEPEAINGKTGQTLRDWLASFADDAAREEVEFEVEVSSSERTSRTEGKGRGEKTFYGATVNFVVTATWPVLGTDKTVSVTFEGEWSDDVQASSMDEV